jgi:Bcr/CflA subfamily drug resistance transporter
MALGNNNAKVSLILLIALIDLPFISETIYTPALPSIATSLAASAHLVEATLAIYFVGFAIGVAIWGAISDWCGRRKAMLMGLCVYGIGTLACGNAECVEALLGWRLVQAFGASVGSVITQTILRDSYDGAQRAKLFSIVAGALAFSPAIGPLLGGLISESWGWRANFWVLSLVAVILFIWSFLLLPETRPAHIERPNASQIWSLFCKMMKSRTLWGHTLLIASTNGILFSFYQEAPFVFIEQLGLRPSHYGFFGIVISAATLLAARCSYKLSNYYSPETLIKQGAVISTVGGVIYTLIVIMGLFKVDLLGMGTTFIALSSIFFGIGLIIPNSLSTALRSYHMQAGTAGSIFGGSYYCLIAGFTWFMSILHNGTALPLPLFITALGLVLTIGSKMVQDVAITAQNKQLYQTKEIKLHSEPGCASDLK